MKSTIEEMLATEEVSHDSKMQYLIARRYLLGDGVKEDATQGVAWLEKAADNGSNRCNFGIGHLLLQWYWCRT